MKIRIHNEAGNSPNGEIKRKFKIRTIPSLVILALIVYTCLLCDQAADPWTWRQLNPIEWSEGTRRSFGIWLVVFVCLGLLHAVGSFKFNLLDFKYKKTDKQ